MEAPLNKICNNWVGYRLRTAEDTDTPSTRTFDALATFLVVAADPQVINKVARYFDEVPSLRIDIRDVGPVLPNAPTGCIPGLDKTPARS